jgi:hypothetical protein
MAKHIHDVVARRAYELFLARGASHGFDLQDWLDAERELTGRNGAAAITPAATARRRPASPRASGKRASRTR